MKIAVLSDIHGNHIALKRCMEELKKRDIKKIIFLGDYVGELAYPQKIMMMLRNGTISHGTVLNRANQLYYEENGRWGWPNLPEKYWEQAVKECLKV